MATRPFHSFAVILAVIAFLLVSAGCGSNSTVICPLGASSSSCGCGAGNVACIQPMYVYATGNGQVAAFPFNQTNGALGTPLTTSGPSATFGLAALNNQFLYVSDPTLNLAGESSVDAWSIDSTTGQLTAVPNSPFALGPLSIANGLAVNTNAQVLYVADAGRIDALKIDSTGALSAINGSPFAAGSQLFLAIDPQNRFLFAADNTPPGGVLAYTLDGTGALTPVPGSPFAIQTNNAGNVQPAQLAVDSTGSFLFAAVTGTGQVAAFSISAPSGTLTQVPGSPFTAGTQPFAVTVSGKFVYVSNLGDATVSGYSFDSTSGVLSPLNGSPFAIHAAALAASPYGGYLAASSVNGVQVYRIDPNSGALTAVGSPGADAGATALAFVP